MKRKFLGQALGLALAVCVLLGGAARADVFNLGGTRNPDGSWNGVASLTTVPVGDPGNAADTTTGYGAVGYSYNIGKYEVTAGQYTEFLNAVAGVDTYALYNTSMWSGTYGCKIERFSGSGTEGSPYRYQVAQDYANRPVNYVSYWDACRFANWLQNGQGNGDTETRAYTLTEQGITDNSIDRNTGWKWAVTSEDEWYKAVYYKGGGTNAGYWLYPTSGDAAPGRDLADGSGNNANYYGAPYPIQSPYFTTVVGEFQNSDSPYGTFDQGGNVWEWNEEIHSGWCRVMRGGSFVNDVICLQSTSCAATHPMNENDGGGFRVSQVPEPASLALLGVGVIAMAIRRKSSVK